MLVRLRACVYVLCFLELKKRRRVGKGGSCAACAGGADGDYVACIVVAQGDGNENGDGQGNDAAGAFRGWFCSLLLASSAMFLLLPLLSPLV